MSKENRILIIKYLYLLDNVKLKYGHKSQDDQKLFPSDFIKYTIISEMIIYVILITLCASLSFAFSQLPTISSSLSWDLIGRNRHREIHFICNRSNRTKIYMLVVILFLEERG